MSATSLAELPVDTALRLNVLRALIYFDLFQHPLRADEVQRFLPGQVHDTGSVVAALTALAEEGLVMKADGHYALSEVAKPLLKRKEENARATARMTKALRMSRLIGRFPFVRGVMISGSLSKGRMAADGDIDFFILAEPQRLWVCRTLLVAFKKIFLLNSHRDLCLNYFVDLDHLSIQDRNVFTATEVMTLIPTYGRSHCDRFFAANSWAQRLLPNAPVPATRNCADGDGRMKKITERLLFTSIGDEIDEWCMLYTLKHWKQKFAEMDHAEFDTALRTRKYTSKHHPQNFQARVLKSFRERIAAFESAHDLELAADLMA